MSSSNYGKTRGFFIPEFCSDPGDFDKKLELKLEFREDPAMYCGGYSYERAKITLGCQEISVPMHGLKRLRTMLNVALGK